MFGSAALEIAIGLVFIYLIFSLVCSAINEWITRVTGLRASTLHAGINQLFGDATDLAAAFHSHPLVRGLPSQGVIRPTSHPRRLHSP